MTYQLQNELNAVQDRLLELRDTIENHCQTIAENCEDMDELDFIFPEINHIYNHDLVNLKIWQNETDWKLSLSSSELKELTIIEESNIDFSKYSYLSVNLDKPKEMIIYEESKEKSHFLSLYIQLQLLMFPDRRQVLEEYISDQAIQSGHTMLTASNLEKASNLTIANLLCYFDKKED